MSIDWRCNFFFNFCAAYLPVLKARYKDEVPVGLFFILDTHVLNKKSEFRLYIYSLTGKCAAQKFKNFWLVHL